MCLFGRVLDNAAAMRAVINVAPFVVLTVVRADYVRDIFARLARRCGVERGRRQSPQSEGRGAPHCRPNSKLKSEAPLPERGGENQRGVFSTKGSRGRTLQYEGRAPLLERRVCWRTSTTTAELKIDRLMIRDRPLKTRVRRARIDLDGAKPEIPMIPI